MITREIMLSAFANDVKSGLLANKKYLLSKYFYDDLGSQIFRQIMAMDEYYPTACEFEILSTRSGDILKALHFETPFNIVEFGSGDGVKTTQLLKSFSESNAEFTYIPIDISSEALEILQQNVTKALPNINIHPMVGDYFEILDGLSKQGRPTLYLFLGGNIGNYESREAFELLSKFRDGMTKGDKLLIGIDLKKDPHVIQNAYDDAAGITKAFNINLLTRINRELEADIDVAQFDFYSHYNPKNGEVHSFLFSTTAQKCYSRVLDLYFQFDENEMVHTELSKKYELSEIAALANMLQFDVIENFIDQKQYFTDSLWVR